MNKKVCDCCSNNVNVETKFKLPSYVDHIAYNKGIQVALFTDLREVDMDLCDECIIRIANFVSAIKSNSKQK